MHIFSSVNKRFIAFVLLLLVGIPLTTYLVRQNQDLRQSAWQVSQSASARCNSNGKVEIEARFTTESGSSKAINVIAKDVQTNNQVDMGTVQPGETKTVIIATDRTSLSNGIVQFALTWANGSSGTDTKNASYAAVATCPQPSPTPPLSSPTPTTPLSSTPVPPTQTPVPTNTPVPTPTPTLPIGGGSPTPTRTPTPTITPTPTDIPPTIVIPTPTGPTPTGPTTCPVPGVVTNVRIECPYCEGQ